MDWKVGAALIVAGVLILTGIFSSGFNIPSFNTSGVSGLFTAASGGGAKSADVDVVLDKVDFSVNTVGDSVEVDLLNPSSEVTVGSSLVDLSSRQTVKMVLEGWNGRITVNGTLSLDGTAESVVIDGIKMNPADRTSKVALSGFDFQNLDVKGVALDKFALPSASGYVYVNGGKTTVRADSDPVELDSFKGELKVDSSFRLSGTAGRVSVAGENTVNIV